MPILAPIATWDAKAQTPLVDWLSSQIPHLKRDDLARLIDSGSALLLLDGLDELGMQHEDGQLEQRFDPRLRFVQQMQRIAGDGLKPSPSKRIVVSCRIKDYSEIGAKLPLIGAVTLQPLNDDQMHDYLHDLPDLWAALEVDNELREIARTPLLLSLFTFAFRDLPQEAKQLRALKRGDLRDKIFETYVRRRYEREARKPYAYLPFTLSEIIAGLGRLAMEDAGGIFIFENTLKYKDFLEVLSQDRIADFIEVVTLLNFLIQSHADEFQFVHLLLRDYFAFNYSIAHLNDLNSFIRSQAVYALTRLGDTRIVETFICILRDEQDSLRRQAAFALGEMNDARAVIPLIEAVEHDPHSHVRRNAIFSLARLGDRNAVSILLKVLKADDRLNRRSAADALGQLGDHQAVDSLVTALKDDDVYVRMSAATALGRLGDTRAVVPLQQCLQDSDPYVRSAVGRALEQIATPEALAAIGAWRKSQLGRDT